MDGVFDKGLSVGQVIELLKKLPQNKPFYVASDEEHNTIFRGLYFNHFEDSVVVAGLSGCELPEMTDEEFKAIKRALDTHGAGCKCKICKVYGVQKRNI